MSNVVQKALLFSFMVTCVGCAFGCARQGGVDSSKYSETKMLMGTVVRLDVCQGKSSREDITAAYDDIWNRLEDISWRMYAGNPGSDVAKINSSNANPVPVGADTYEILEHSIDLYHSSRGTFDITVGPLIELWKKSERESIVPVQSQIAAAKVSVGSDKIRLLSNNRVMLTDPKTKIDLGGIAKGYAVDEAARLLRGHGYTRFFIDAGGDVYAGGLNCRNQPWKVGIRHPRPGSGLMDVVYIVNASVATSGNYERYFTIGKQRWSHIINPVTGYPQQDAISATVIAPTAMEADALATALSVLGRQAGTDFINRKNQDYASIIIADRGAGRILKMTSKTYQSFRQHL